MKKCDCYSYNWDIGGTATVTLYNPFEFRKVCIDNCIYDVIKTLWQNHIPTLNSCCGHNREEPSIIFHNEVDAIRAKELLKEIDDRNFRCMTWILTEIE